MRTMLLLLLLLLLLSILFLLLLSCYYYYYYSFTANKIHSPSSCGYTLHLVNIDLHSSLSSALKHFPPQAWWMHFMQGSLIKSQGYYAITSEQDPTTFSVLLDYSDTIQLMVSFSATSMKCTPNWNQNSYVRTYNT